MPGIPVRARQSALCTVGLGRPKERIGRPRTISLNSDSLRGVFILYGRTQLLGEIDEHEFGILHRKWARL